MGLDIAELMIAFEEEFNVDIFESDAQKIETVGDMVDLLSRQLVGAPTRREEAERNHREGVRQASEALSETLGIESASFNEETLLKNLFPLENRNDLWERVRNRFPDRLLELERHFSCLGFLVSVLGTLLLVVVGSLFAARRFPAEPVFWMALAVMIFAAIFLLCFCQSREKIDFPYDCSNVKDLARRIIPDQICVDGNGNPWSRKTIERIVKAVAAEHLGVKPEEVDLSMRFGDMF